MQFNHSKKIKLKKKASWDFLTNIHNWTDSLKNTKITKQINDNTYEIKTKVTLGLFHLELIGQVVYNHIVEKDKLHITIHQDSKSIQIKASIDTEVIALSDITSEIKILSNIELTGPLSGIASNITKEIFTNLFETLLKKTETI